ncbi:MAG: (Fe-S)-binding protein, partial [Pseudomonadota bacterium]
MRGSGPVDAPAGPTLANCTACGLCNDVCPTYLETADEREGPRGRIGLMQMLAADGRRSGEGLETIERHLATCIACGACERACPEDVPFEAALHDARAELFARGCLPAGRSKLYAFFAERIATPDKFGRIVRLLQAMPKVSRRMLGSSLGALADSIASAGIAGGGAQFGGAGTALTSGVARGRVMLAGGCLERMQRPAMIDAAIRLLARRGFDVEVPADAGCCGAIASELGVTRAADDLEARNV